MTLSLYVRSDGYEQINSDNTKGLVVSFSLCTADSNARTLYANYNLRKIALSSEWQKIKATVTLSDDFFTSGTGTIDDTTKFYLQIYDYSTYSMQVKTDWKETDIITYEKLNAMIVNNMNNLKTYSRSDLEWYYIPSLANIDYTTANWIERNINALATQIPLEPDVFKLTVENGYGSGEYEANVIVHIQANPPDEGTVFDHWSGDHLENMDNPSASYEDIINEFGTPEAVVSTFDTDEYETLLKSKKKQSLLLKILTVILIIALLFTSFLLYKAIEDENISIKNDFEQTN